MKSIIKTPKGIISIHPSSDPNYPGVYIDINGVQVALIEWDDTAQKHAVRVWDGKEEDFVFKQEYDLKETE